MLTVSSSPWLISEAGYPAAGTPSERLEWMLGYAVLAPSTHNTQPWRFRVAGGEALLFADRARGLAVADPAGRELAISCGAALFLLRVAIRRFGFVDEVALFPDDGDPDLLAAVRLGEPAEPGPEVMRLFTAITRRRTHRLRFEDRPVPADAAAALALATADEGASLAVVEDAAVRSAIAALAREGDREQFADPDFRRELSSWVSTSDPPRRDGMPASAFGIPDIVSPLGVTLMGAVNLGVVWGGRSHQAVENAPLLAVLHTERDAPADWLAAGQALARTLLVATDRGLAAGFVNQPVQVPPLRARLRETLRIGGWPQMVLRVGYPHRQVPPTPRRPVDEVLEG
jgi:nitroreductase